MSELSRIDLIQPNMRAIQAFQTESPSVDPLSFNKIFKESLAEVNGLDTQAKTMVESLATGKTHDVSGVMVAVQKSNLAFTMLLQVRNKLIDSYDEIMRMRL